MSKELIDKLEALRARTTNHSYNGVYNDAVDRAIATVRQHTDWQPIATAPKDGSLIDLWAQERERYQYERITDCFFYQGKWVHTQTIYDEDNELELSEVFNPTHWIALPDPPRKE